VALDDVCSPLRCLDEESVDLLPGGVIADGDAGVQDETFPLPDLLAEIGE
jgi:hypothetical protein